MDGPTIAALLARAPALEELMLVGSSHRITDEVADALMGLSRLRCLHVCCTDEKRLVQGHERFARFFEDARLQVLGLMGRGLVTDVMLSHIATIPTLEKLGLWYMAGDDLSDCGMAAFASNLQTTSLEMIQFSDIHQITDRALFDLISRQSRLKHLDIAGCNGLTDKGLLRALQIGEAKTQLQSVSVQDCAMITDRAIVKLVQTLGPDAVSYRKHGW
ncbi:hypothetical protein BX666DRAFT_1880734 [Dichotomocladium elegans]|nr:hypothetical protein BX666DRAFT_1880734 [Dichotomocladium elegans]